MERNKKTTKNNNNKDLNSKKGKSAKVVAFTIDEVLTEFSLKFFDEDFCREFILNKLHPEGATCSNCDCSIKDETTLRNFYKDKKCICKKCGKGFSSLAGTFLYNTHFTFSQLILLTMFTGLSERNITVSDIAKFLNASPGTVRNYINKFRNIENDNRQ